MYCKKVDYENALEFLASEKYSNLHQQQLPQSVN